MVAASNDSTPAPSDNPTASDIEFGGRVGQLRGAGVASVNVRALARGAFVVGLVALVVLSISFFVAGAHSNAQINRLRSSAVPVKVTISGCFGELGGSGSNAAGYTCRGDFTLGGHRYNEALPGMALYAKGAVIDAVAVPADPALVAPLPVLAGEHATGRVFILPSVLGALVLVALVLVGWRRRSTSGKVVGARPAPSPKAA